MEGDGGGGEGLLAGGDGPAGEEGGQPRDKRLRTTILPEQLDLLYVHYAADSNPSRKQLEAIAHAVRLRKRVVQVWFQNTRARERKGQARAPQLIRKRCPLCNALFRARSALESHLAAKHADAAAAVVIDDLPDAEPEAEGVGVGAEGVGELDANMKRLYEDSLRRYLSELTESHVAGVREGGAEDSPLDLSRPGQPPATPREGGAGGGAGGTLHDDSFSETHSESTDAHSGPSSPSGSMTSQPPALHRHSLTPGGMGGYGGGSVASKRYRTQMSEQQIGIMKLIFVEYKTPTMGECEMLGQEIALAKRVVQVWFQNARAKEKKLGSPAAAAAAAAAAKPDATECRLCDFQYTHKYTVQDHIFTRRHIQRLARTVHSEIEASDPDQTRGATCLPTDDALIPQSLLAPLANHIPGERTQPPRTYCLTSTTMMSSITVKFCQKL